MSYEIREYNDIDKYSDLPEHVVSGLETCIASAFGGGITADDAREHMSGQQILVASVDLDAATYVVKGFSSTSITSPSETFKDDTLEDRSAVYFAGAAICSTVQGTGLYQQLNQRRIRFALDKDIDTIFTRTQNPRVEEGITSTIDRLVQQGELAAFVLSSTISVGAYGRMLTDARPQGRRVVYDDLDYDQGDAKILTWRLKK